MTEADFLMMLLMYAAGFLTGGVFWYDLAKRREDKKNCERNNRLMGWHSNNPEFQKLKEK